MDFFVQYILIIVTNKHLTKNVAHGPSKLTKQSAYFMFSTSAALKAHKYILIMFGIYIIGTENLGSFQVDNRKYNMVK